MRNEEWHSDGCWTDFCEYVSESARCSCLPFRVFLWFEEAAGIKSMDVDGIGLTRQLLPACHLNLNQVHLLQFKSCDASPGGHSGNT